MDIAKKNKIDIQPPEISYTRHAIDRMIDRGITPQEVEKAFIEPINAKSAQQGRRETQGWVIRSGQKKLLRVVSEGDINILVITVMVTSKFEKYGVSK
jgi:hypothetical protein